MDPHLYICSLSKKDDPDNQLILGHDRLIVIFKSKPQVFQRSSILNFELTKKKLIVALVIGGIGTSMAMVAMSMGWYHRTLNLLTIFFFFGVLYYGFIGKEAIEIFEKGHSSIFLLKKLLPSIRQFEKFFKSNQAHLHYTGQNFIYHLTDPKDWENQLKSEVYSADSLNSEGFIHASTSEQVAETYQKYYSERESMVLITIVADFLTSKLEYDLNTERNQHFPHIYGPINKTAVVRLQYYSNQEKVNLNIEK